MKNLLGNFHAELSQQRLASQAEQSQAEPRERERERESEREREREANLETRLKCLWPNKISWVHTLPQCNKKDVSLKFSHQKQR